ncbi:MAG: hypothetical protein ACFB2X_06265 [Rivularia sp. (in: cyanobacteria)]
MIRRLIVTSVLAVLSATAIAPKANAQSIDVPFTGTVGGACSFSKPVPGTLKPYSQRSTNSSSPRALIGNVQGKVTVNCNSSAKVRASAPVQTGGPKFTPKSSSASIKFAGTNHSYGTNTNMPLKTGESNIEVFPYIDKGTPLEPGTYSYRVTLTITP